MVSFPHELSTLIYKTCVLFLKCQLLIAAFVALLAILMGIDIKNILYVKWTNFSEDYLFHNHKSYTYFPQIVMGRNLFNATLQCLFHGVLNCELLNSPLLKISCHNIYIGMVSSPHELFQHVSSENISVQTICHKWCS